MFVVRRNQENPLISPKRGDPWQAVATFNPSAVRVENGVRVYFRAVGSPDALVSPHAGRSTIGTAFSEDGVHFNIRRQVIMPKEPWEASGCEDPRATFFEGKWYVFYTALGGYPFGPDNIKVAVAIGDAPDHFTERHLVTPFNAKAATLLPSRVNGDVFMLLTAHTDWTKEYPRPTIAVARAKEFADFLNPGYWEAWHAHLEDHALGELRIADDDHVEVGAAPILTEKGWLFIYSYIQHYYDESRRLFTIEAALFEKDDPQKLISRTHPLLVPEEIYEEYGLVPHIVFPSGASVHNDMLEIWYGAADTVCAKAEVKLPQLVRSLDPSHPARTFTRAPENPILTPQGNGFESSSVFNPAAIDLDGSVYILYRAMGSDHTSTIGCARAKDGIHIDERLPEPCFIPRADFELKHHEGNSGCEDPRAVIIDGRIYMTYTAYDGVRSPKGAVASINVGDFLAKRFSRWSIHCVLTPDDVDDKDLGLLSEKVDGNFLLYHRISSTICADLLPDLGSGRIVSRCIEIMGPRPGMWDEAKVGIAAPPLKVDAGWLLIYHGVSGHGRYRLGAALLDHSGIAILARTADPIFEPVEKYELEGDIPNVVFACGAVVRGDTVYMYYGGGDKVVGVATASLSYILSALT